MRLHTLVKSESQSNVQSKLDLLKRNLEHYLLILVFIHVKVVCMVQNQLLIYQGTIIVNVFFVYSPKIGIKNGCGFTAFRLHIVCMDAVHIETVQV